ncbi:Putative S-adenosylmethionine-dependent methyltransferase RcsF [Seminavis robusta]|uniref:S-adenosylmethionine-dependent methyltransferase RcsF n=1 Tax=Seminavis robusta TaxID=568900 RepID=A0A9N8ECQ3_9STRA|nr:Putative S-adenosylmethionine-dependent methyltransferase RcsF [Seminavis robusta]|eukprot:Sro982_g227640.1 Putative S-adenosylmethionine-dependent methyltransferase RcsF (448) ;mRNA; f:13175-14518
MTINSSSTASTILAGLSVVLSFASLMLSYRTWQRQSSYLLEDQKPTADLDNDDPASLSPARTPSTSINTTTSTNKASSAHDNNTRIRATVENQLLSHNNNNGLNVQPIGVIRSVYKLCVGTPRQGLLAPHARGRIELTLPVDAAMDSVQELDTFSHIWILFVFHLNTLASSKKVSPKIAPPALGGKKVGVLATRSPHRFNPIGMTLAKLDRVEIKDKKAFKSQQQLGSNTSRVVLHISGLDLVDGTPVLDVKPFVPVYDSVQSSSDNSAVRLPPWVSEGLATRRSVVILEKAKQDLQNILLSSSNKKKKPLEFYGRGDDESDQDTLDNMLACITEVLAMDVRSSWQTQKARKGNYQAERAHRLKKKNNHASSSNKPVQSSSSSSDVQSNSTSEKKKNADKIDTCTQQLDNLLLHYRVTQASDLRRSTSEGSGAEDQVCVTAIEHLLS